MAGAGANPSYSVSSEVGILALLQQGVTVTELIKSWVFLFAFIMKSIYIFLSYLSTLISLLLVFSFMSMFYYTLGFLIVWRMNLTI